MAGGVRYNDRSFRTGKESDPMNTFSWIFLALLLLDLAIQGWLARRQIRTVRAHRDRVPEPFTGTIEEATHRRAADYTVAKTRFGRLEAGYGALILLGWTLGGGVEAVDRLWRGLELPPLAVGTGMVLSVLLIGSLLELPTSAWRTFVLEQRFGFNRTTPGLFVGDLLKGTLLTLLLGGPLVAVVLWLMEVAGPLWWVWAWGVWFGFSLLMMWAWPTLIAPLFNRFEPLEDEALKSRIEALLREAGFHSSGIFVMDGSRRSAHGNAYFTGLGGNKRIVFFDTLLRQLSPDEIEAVLAHELGHFRRHHVRKRLAGMAGLALAGLALLGWLMEQPWFYQGLGYHLPGPGVHVALVLFMLASPVFSFFLSPLLAWLSRRQEFEADEFAARLRGPHHLVEALVKLYAENAATLTPDPLYSAFHDSHPPAPVRVRHLQRLAEGAS